MSKINDQYIIEMYVEKNKSTHEIAKDLNTYPNKILRILKKHNIKIKSKSEAQKLALKEGRMEHPTKGKKRTDEEKLTISEKMADHWKSLPKEEREDRKVKAKERWDNRDAASKEKMNRLRVEAVRKAGKEGSKLEKFILKKLTDNGYRVDFHNQTLIPNEKLEIDLYIPELNTIIEVDGPSHFLPIWGEEKLQKQIKADLQKNGRILSRGFAIIRVKVLDKPNLKRKQDMVDNVLSILKGIEKKFPPKSQRFIEVDL